MNPEPLHLDVQWQKVLLTLSCSEGTGPASGPWTLSTEIKGEESWISWLMQHDKDFS